jgi:lipoprotein-anchoring transpeptidase ErfK/SrfK
MTPLARDRLSGRKQGPPLHVTPRAVGTRSRTPTFHKLGRRGATVARGQEMLPWPLPAPPLTRARPRFAVLGALLSAWVGTACDPHDLRFRLTRTESANVPEPPAGGPELGAIAQATPVRSLPEAQAPVLGYLHAGARVTRADKAVGYDDCRKGWYPIRPRGFVCLGEGATLDLEHPTLAAMATQPERDASLPYAYARTRNDAQLFEVDETRERAVRAEREVTSLSGMAVVGSWEAAPASDAPLQTYAMMTNGRFLAADNLEEAVASEFQGVTLSDSQALPLAFVITRDAQRHKITSTGAERTTAAAYHAATGVTDKTKTVDAVDFVESTDGYWLRSADVTVATLSDDLPADAKTGRRWVDISISQHTLVAYEGSTPKYVTLVSTGKAKGSELRETLTGEFTIIAKHITALNAQVQGFADRVEIHDTPWLLELSSGQLVHGAFWHDRFGLDHGLGHVQLAPKDAAYLWHWVGAPVPEGWHAVVVDPAREGESDSNPAPESLPALVRIRR